MSGTKPVTIKIDSLTVNNLGIFNKITAPVEYPDTFIKQCQESGELSKYAYFSEVPVGVIVLKPLINKSPVALNITILKVLDAYSWNFNVESKLIQYALDLCPKRHLNICTILTKKLNNKLIDILKKEGFQLEENTSNDIYNSLSIAEDEVLYIKTI